MLNRPLKNVFEAADARQKRAGKRSLCVINAHFEPVFNTAAATQIVFQRPVNSNFVRLRGLLLAALMALSVPVAAEEWIYTVRPGDNLWNLTERHLKSIDYVQKLQQLNNVRNPYVMPPGTQLRIPTAWTRFIGDALAQVTSVYGTVTLQRSGQEDKPVELGMQLLVGDEIRSGNDAFAVIEFADKSHLRVQNNTRLRLENMRIFGDYGLIDTLIDLQHGRTESSVPGKSQKSTRFRIKTPSAISLVRGTDFRVGIIEEAQSSGSEVLTGVVEVNSEKKPIKVPAGYGITTSRGIPPGAPIKLLPPPDLSETAGYYERLPLVIQLKPLSGAHAYRAQIAIDRDFADLWSEFVTTALPFRNGEIPDGDYWLRIRGIDESRIEGKDAVIPFSLNARPEAPFIIAPLPGGATAPQQQEFKWALQSEASHYALMISPDSDFTRVIYFNPEVQGNSLTLSESLTPGHYFWRIFSVSAGEGAGPMSDVMPFRVPYPGPSLEATQLNEKEMTFVWRAAAEGQSFHFQLARDQAFTGIIHDEMTPMSQITVAKPGGGTYYLRIKTIESDGFQGPWGALQTVEIPYSIPPWLMLLMLLPLLVLL
ncbi:FecR domain-containing protein [Nitrosomonas sp.]|uniref:FecR domain-containing protein n=1 Tax=Nitrosomonas sp. TaxID=42353 RepID=UPI002625779F|nr:FecR domain-containing protein [Nitrosomonas sp.]